MWQTDGRTDGRRTGDNIKRALHICCRAWKNAGHYVSSFPWLYRYFCSACAMTVVIFGHLNRSFYLLTRYSKNMIIVSNFLYYTNCQFQLCSHFGEELAFKFGFSDFHFGEWNAECFTETTSIITFWCMQVSDVRCLKTGEGATFRVASVRCTYARPASLQKAVVSSSARTTFSSTVGKYKAISNHGRVCDDQSFQIFISTSSLVLL